ncbi:MAG: nuclear transport factor 2 family protein [Methanobacterium sp.]
MNEAVKSDSLKKIETDRENIIMEVLNLFGSSKFKEVLPFFAVDCKTHNPYISGDMDSLTDAMIAAGKDMIDDSEAEFSVKHVIVDGDFIAAYAQLLNNKSKPEEGGLRQVHLFRFNEDKIIEYWDITQEVRPDMPNASGAF